MTDAAETRRRIMEAAQRQFSHHGYTGTSVKSVAAEAGVTTGAVYHHFGSKAGTYFIVGTDAVEGLLKEYDEQLATRPEELNQRERIAALFDVFQHKLHSRPEQARNGISVELDAARYEVAAEARDQWAGELEVLYSRATGEPIETRGDDWWDFTKATILVDVLSLGLSRYVTVHGTEGLDVAIAGIRRLLFGRLETGTSASPGS